MCLLTALFLASAVVRGAQLGQPAPDFTAKDIHGKTHKLSDYKGKIVVLEAYNLDCPFSAHHYKTGAMQELQADVIENGGVWLVVNSVHPDNSNYRTTEAAQREFKEQKMKATAWIDDSSGKLGKQYGMRTTPHMFVINKDGVLVYDGAIDDRAAAAGDPRKARNYVSEALKAVKAGDPVKVASTKPYGCSVKYE